MTQTIEVDLIDVLNRLEGKIDNLDTNIEQKVNNLDNKIDNLDSKIEQKIDNVNTKIDNLANEVNDIKVDVATLKEGQNSVTTRLDGVETRLNTLIAVAFTALLGTIGKLIFIK